jgi:hypothetical protein
MVHAHGCALVDTFPGGSGRLTRKQDIVLDLRASAAVLPLLRTMLVTRSALSSGY